jgi:exopolysaccharide biosynthesis polyprenyl glycosylphosphotransferase
LRIFGLQKIPRYKIVYAIVDVTTIFLCFLFSVYSHRKNQDLSLTEFFSLNKSLIYILVILTSGFIVIFQYNGLYRINIILSRAAHFANIIKAQYYGALNIVLISLLMQTYEVVDARLIIFTYIILVIPTLYLVRVELLREIFNQLRNNTFKRNVIIVGDGRSGKLLATKLLLENYIGIEIIGFVDDDKEIDDEVVGGKKVIGKLDNLGKVISEYKIDEIIVAIDGDNHEKLFEVLDFCKSHNINVRLTSELFEIVTKKVDTEKYIDIPIVDVSAQYNNKITLSIKRLIDIGVSLIAIIIMSPVMLLIAILVKLSSKGPVLFSQIRIGRYGRPFRFYKFRSMKVLTGEDEVRKQKMIEFMRNNVSGGNDTKIINDMRVTWIGKIIRKASIDELPQLFNVLKGEMSLVGPRPCLPYEYDNYDIWQKRRLSAIPGCTGVWQVCGRSSVSFKDSIVLDLYYINNMSPWFDLQLIFKTIPAMLFLRGGK